MCGLLVPLTVPQKVLKTPDDVVWLAFLLPGRLAVVPMEDPFSIWNLESSSCVEIHDIGVTRAFAMRQMGGLQYP